MCHVLIIEDEPLVALDLEDMLRGAGATSVAFAQSQSEAVASALDHRPEVITSDVQLLEGTGPKAISIIHDQLGCIPVIFITASPDQCQPCNPPGIILPKPLNGRAIQEAFRELGHIDQ